MTRRFQHHSIENLTWVEAIPRESPLLDYYSSGLVPEVPYYRWRGNIACYASHLKAIRQFLHQGGEKAIICEDDILFHNDFISLYHQVVDNLPEDFPLLTMCYMMTSKDGCHLAGKNPSLGNLLTIDSAGTWGAQMYLITKAYAIQVLTKYDMPFSLNPDLQITSENIIRRSQGYMTSFPLVIEEGVDSDRDPQDIPFHLTHFKFWGYSNYSSGEDGISPLAQEVVPNAF